MNEPIPFGKYLLVEQIAVGGMAEIYKAIAFLPDGRQHPLAIKRILPQYANDDEFISMMVDEAKVMVLLNHPNIVPIVEFGKIEDTYFIAMEFVRGVTLKDLFRKVLNNNQPFDLDVAVHIVREVGNGLAYAHRKTDAQGHPLDIVHRDISPANILISFEGDIQIADFGISKASNQSHRTQIGIIRGKTGYMSPEQTRANLPIDHRSDIYSLGIILFELLTGKRLYQADSVPKALQMIREGQIPSIRDIRQEVPLDLEAVVLKALSPKPEDRFQRAELFVDALNEYVTRQVRQRRVTQKDLVDFLHQYYADEMTVKPVEYSHPGTMLVDMGKTEVDTQIRKPSTIAANPLYEFSQPEFEFSDATTVGSDSSTERTEPNEMNPFESNSSSFNEKVLGLGLFKVLLLFAGLLFAGGVIFLWKRSPSRPHTASQPSGKNVEVEEVEPKTESRLTTQAIVEIATEPSGAKVTFEERELFGVTPLELPPLELRKEYSLKISSSGYRTIESKISRAIPGRIIQRFFLAENDKPIPPPVKKPPPPQVAAPQPLGQIKKMSKLSVKTEPWSEVYVDGKHVDASPFFEKSIPGGSHVIRYVSDQYEPYEFRIKIPPGEDVKCFYNFASGKGTCKK